MVRDWCQYKGEGVSKDEDEGGEDLISLLLLFNLDHCVDLIACKILFDTWAYCQMKNFQVILMFSPLVQLLGCLLLGGGRLSSVHHL